MAGRKKMKPKNHSAWMLEGNLLSAKPFKCNKKNYKEDEMDKAQYDELLKLLHNLKENDKIISDEDKRGKYRKSYARLRAKILQSLSEFLKYTISDLKIRDDEKKEVADALIAGIQKSLDKSKAIGLFNEVANTAFATYNINEIAKKAEPIRDAVIADVYGEYWLSKCTPVNGGTYTFHNSIVDMYYNPELDMWAKNGEDGTVSFTILFPPTKRQMDKAYPKRKSAKAHS